MNPLFTVGNVVIRAVAAAAAAAAVKLDDGNLTLHVNHGFRLEVAEPCASARRRVHKMNLHPCVRDGLAAADPQP